jgi:hypothetical protein
MIASLLFWLCSPLCLDETGHESDQHEIIAGFVGYPILIRQIGLHSRSLNLLEPALLQSHTTVAVPLDQCIIVVSLLHCAEFSRRLSEVPQTLDAISGIQFLF